MSKKLQNYPDPMDLVSTVGADSMRFYLLASPAAKGEDFNFIEKEVLELQRKNIGRLHNVLAMYEMFQNGTKASVESTHVLDRWILARLQELVNESTEGYKKYELDKATRPITDFIDDLSVWYLRRSRDRVKGVRQSGGLSQEVASDSDVRKNSDNLNSSCKEDEADKALTLATLRYTLRTLALVMAPVTPFYAEYLWQAVKEEGDAESVHLGKWPENKEFDGDLLVEMSTIRDVVTAALEARTKAGIKVRQPLSLLRVLIDETIFNDEFKLIIADEVNVKEVVLDKTIERMVELDTILTPELIAEGNAREFMRGVQERRKAEGLAPRDRVALTVATSAEGKLILEQFAEMIKKTVGATELNFTDTEGTEIKAGDVNFVVALKKL